MDKIMSTSINSLSRFTLAISLSYRIVQGSARRYHPKEPPPPRNTNLRLGLEFRDVIRVRVKVRVNVAGVVSGGFLQGGGYFLQSSWGYTGPGTTKGDCACEQCRVGGSARRSKTKLTRICR